MLASFRALGRAPRQRGIETPDILHLLVLCKTSPTEINSDAVRCRVVVRMLGLFKYNRISEHLLVLPDAV